MLGAVRLGLKRLYTCLSEQVLLAGTVRLLVPQHKNKASSRPQTKARAAARGTTKVRGKGKIKERDGVPARAESIVSDSAVSAACIRVSNRTAPSTASPRT